MTSWPLSGSIAPSSSSACPAAARGPRARSSASSPTWCTSRCGDVFRKLPKYGTLGKEIVDFTSQGFLVPDDLTVRIWERHIKILELQEFLLPEIHTLILDGLPRNYTQAERLDHMLDVVQIFHLKIADNAKAMERLKSRALRENRLDDINEEVIRRRLKTYYDETYQTLSFYDPVAGLRHRRRPVAARRPPRHHRPDVRAPAAADHGTRLRTRDSSGLD